MLARRQYVPAFLGLSAVVLTALATTSEARTREECQQIFQPQSGQAGKDVVWVPTGDALVTHMLTMAKVTAADRVFDLGAGDGKIAIAAAKQFGATSTGVEYNPDMVKLAQCFVEAEGVGNRVKIIQGDIFQTDFSSATVVTLYLLPDLNLRLRPTILKMKPGTRVVSHSFLMDDWEPDERYSSQDGQAYLWYVPADVKGTWTFAEKNGKDRIPVTLEQTFQSIKGTSGRYQLNDTKLQGDRIELGFTDGNGAVKIDGRVVGNQIEATVTRGGQTKSYVATRS
jgi:SAM-dependent methyltransferase